MLPRDLGVFELPPGRRGAPGAIGRTRQVGECRDPKQPRLPAGTPFQEPRPDRLYIGTKQDGSAVRSLFLHLKQDPTE